MKRSTKVVIAMIILAGPFGYLLGFIQFEVTTIQSEIRLHQLMN